MFGLTEKPQLGKVTFNVTLEFAGGTRTTKELHVYEELGAVWFRNPEVNDSFYGFLCPLRDVIAFEPKAGK